MSERPAEQLVSHDQQRYYAERLIDDLNNIEAARNLTVNELDARTVARWLLLALPQPAALVAVDYDLDRLDQLRTALAPFVSEATPPEGTK